MCLLDKPVPPRQDWQTLTFGQWLEINGDVPEVLRLGRLPCEALAPLRDRIYGPRPGWMATSSLREKLIAFGRTAFDAEIARRAAL